MSLPPPESWNSFLNRFRRQWRQGEHIFINGQTGSGKTDLMLRLLELRRYATFMVSKPRDPIIKSALTSQYRRMDRFKPSATTDRILLVAESGDSTRGEIGNQYETFSHALDSIYHAGGWAIGIDETLWISNRLKLAHEVGDIAYLGRALGLTGIFATQRPAHIPVIIPQSCTYAFLGKTSRDSDLKTLAELGGDVRETREALRALRGRHEFLYVDTTGRMPLEVIDTHA